MSASRCLRRPDPWSCRDTEGPSFQAVCAQSLLDHSRRVSQELQLQPFSCSANLIVSINFKTHTFP